MMTTTFFYESSTHLLVEKVCKLKELLYLFVGIQALA